VHGWHTDPDFMRYMGPVTFTRERTASALGRYECHWQEHGFGLLAAEDRETGALIGRTGLQYHRAWAHDPEVGWGLDPAWWGRGLATEMGVACVAWGFEDLGFLRLVSITIEENLPSRRIMEKLGFRLHEKVHFAPLDLELWVHALDRPQ
jgi:RimJ/RimL family protein N-acetyltransferase